MRHAHNPKFGAVCFRRTYPQIKLEGGLWDQSKDIYTGHAEQRLGDLQWRFKSGARVSFRHCQFEKNLEDYDGAQIALLMFDQLEQFTSTQFFYLLSRNRTDCGINAYCRATCNPDPDSWLAGFLDWWIDDEGFPIDERSGIVRYFVRRNNVIEWGDTPEELSDDPALVKSATFIPSLPDDNPIGMRLNPGYMANLMALPRYLQMRRRWGNWKAKPEAGKVINRQWFNIVDDPRASQAEAVLFWDFAATEKKFAKSDPDYTAAVLMLKQRPTFIGGEPQPPRFLIANVFAGQLAPADVDKEFVLFSWQCHAWCKGWDTKSFKVRWEIEPGSAGKREALRYTAMLQGIDALGVRPVKDKLTRALPFVSQAEARNVDVLRGEWNDRYLNELHNYPEAEHDDVWDANSGAFNELAGLPSDGEWRPEDATPTPSRWTTGRRKGSRWRR